jgi:hypothetical protein
VLIKVKKYFFAIAMLISLIGFISSANFVSASTLLSDNFTGTIINTVKWNEIDPSGSGGTSGDVQQNGSLTIANSNFGGAWAHSALYSKDSFSSSTLEVSAIIIPVSDTLIGYGDYNFQSAGTSAFIIDVQTGGNILALSWSNGGFVGSTACGTDTTTRTYKLKVVSGGFEVYKDGTLLCSHSTSATVNNKPVFFEASAAASTFDDALVTGTANSSSPDAPTGLIATPGSGQVSLAWTAPASNGSSITDYIIEYKLSSEPTVWTTFNDGVSTLASTTVTGLTNGVSYDFRVKAVNSVGTSSASSVISTTPSAPTLPAAPTVGTATPGNVSSSITFTSGSNGGSNITGYTVTSSPGGFTGTGSSSPITVNGLTNGTSYTFKVTATNAIGTSSASNASNSVTPSAEVPTTISNLALWLDASDASSVVTSSGNVTQINDKSGNSKNFTASGGLAPALVNNAQNGRSLMRFNGSNRLSYNASITYRTVFVVAQYNGTTFGSYNGIIGDVSGSSPNNGHILNGVSGTTKLAIATASFTSAYKNGTLVAGSSGHDFSPLNQYWIGSFELPTNTTNTASDIGEIAGGGRTWNGDIAEVIVYSSALSNSDRASVEGYLSTKWNIAVAGPTAPIAPSSLVADAGSTQVGLTWAASANGGSAITDYIIEYKLSSEPTVWTTFNDGVSTLASTTVTGLTNGVSYDFRVKAVNSIGTGTASSTTTATPATPTVPGAPTSLSAVAANTQANLSWTAPVISGGSSITNYSVEYKLVSEPTVWTVFSHSTSASTSITVTGLTNGVAYNFRVSAINAIGTGATSNTTTTTPALIGNVLVDDFTGTTINITKWNEIDPMGSGGTTGKIQQNGNLTIADSYVNSIWGANALVSQDTFVSTGLEISATITAGSSPLIGYGDYAFGTAPNKAFLLYITAPSSGILALAWNNGAYTPTSCGTADAGAAVYKMKIVSGGFEVYKNNVLLCTHTTSVTINNASVFFENSAAASTFDDVLVYGTVTTHSAPDAPIIGTATSGNHQATIIFTPPNYNGGSAITGYTVTSSPGVFTATGTSSPIVVTGLTNGTNYTFTVTATNAIGISSFSSASNTATPFIPPLPGTTTNLVVTATNKTALLNWNAPASGGTIDDYLVEYKLSSDSSWTTFVDGVSTAAKSILIGLTNDASYDFRVSATNGGGSGVASDIVTATPSAISTLAFVITGESNSGGIGPNSDATVGELSPHHAVQITNLTSGQFLYEDLHIGVNNLRDHTGLESYFNTSHGFELELANKVEANAFPDNPLVYLTKTGHGGSQVAQWNVGGTYWTKFLQRINAAKTQLPSNKQWVVWLSLGINDSIAGTPTSTWKTAMIAHINKIKVELPGAIIVMTEFQSMPAGSGYPAYNAVIDQIAASEANVFTVDSTGAGTDGANHWLYQGLKTITDRLVVVTKNALGLNYPGLPTLLNVTPTGTSISLSWTGPIANGGTVITDYKVEYKLHSLNTWATFADGVSTSTTTTITGLTGSSNYDVQVSALNSVGSGNPLIANTSTTDSVAPVISNVSVSISGNNIIPTITWSTDEISSSIVEYGLASNYGSSTTEANTSPRLTSHTVVLPGVLPCGTYHFRVKSNDSSSNLATGTDMTFSTAGCTSTVTNQSQGTIINSTGGTVTLAIGSISIGLNIPAGSAGSDANFQINKLDPTGTLNVLGSPSGVHLAGTQTYELKAFTGTNSLASSFSHPVTVTLNYQDSDVSGINEASLVIYHYSGGVWTPLSNCVVDTTANTISCVTTGFSVFGLFGTAIPVSVRGGGGLLPEAYKTPITPQDGFKVLINNGARSATSSNVTLSFNVGRDVTKMAISNSVDFANANQEDYSATKNWDLCSSPTGPYSVSVGCTMGKKTVYALFYTNYGQPSAIIQSSIEYLSNLNNTNISVTHSVGVNIKDANGTIYTLAVDGSRRPYTSAGSFLSYTFNSFTSVVKANSADLALPTGSFITPREGSIICSDRGADKGACYLITEGKKAGFTSAKVFKDQGFSFAVTVNGDVSFMESTSLIDNSAQAHRKGTLVKSGKTIYLVSLNSLIGIPSITVLKSWGYYTSESVPLNSADALLPKSDVLEERIVGKF